MISIEDSNKALPDFSFDQDALRAVSNRHNNKIPPEIIITKDVDDFELNQVPKR